MSLSKTLNKHFPEIAAKAPKERASDKENKSTETTDIREEQIANIKSKIRGKKPIILMSTYKSAGGKLQITLGCRKRAPFKDLMGAVSTIEKIVGRDATILFGKNRIQLVI